MVYVFTCIEYSILEEKKNRNKWPSTISTDFLTAFQFFLQNKIEYFF
jgi:hypothetical protein